MVFFRETSWNIYLPFSGHNCVPQQLKVTACGTRPSPMLLNSSKPFRTLLSYFAAQSVQMSSLHLMVDIFGPGTAYAAYTTG
ncbi:hypothetical protein MHYP_G00106730 [Metynnis hypsauchen]